MIVTEPDFVLCRPSLIASACICAAARGLNIPSSDRAMEDICKMTGADLITAECIVNHIERVVAKETESTHNNSVSTHGQQQQTRTQQVTSTPVGKLPQTPDNSFIEDDDLRQPETPTDVQDIHF